MYQEETNEMFQSLYEAVSVEPASPGPLVTVQVEEVDFHLESWRVMQNRSPFTTLDDYLLSLGLLAPEPPAPSAPMTCDGLGALLAGLRQPPTPNL